MAITANTLGKLLGHEPIAITETPGRIINSMSIDDMPAEKAQANPKPIAKEKASKSGYSREHYLKNKERILARQKEYKNRVKKVDKPKQGNEITEMIDKPKQPASFGGVNIDEVDHPAHYTAGQVECIDALEAATTGLQGIEAVCTANAIKYLWRWKHKNGVQDLKKARWYLERMISSAEKVNP